MIVIDLISKNPHNKFAPYARMANAIVEIKKKKGGCLPQDLHAKEFTPAEVAERWHMANAMAEVELKLEKQ